MTAFSLITIERIGYNQDDPDGEDNSQVNHKLQFNATPKENVVSSHSEKPSPDNSLIETKIRFHVS